MRLLQLLRCLAELLILSKGVARSVGEASSFFEIGTFFGEMQFLGLESKRAFSVVVRDLPMTADRVWHRSLTTLQF